MNQNLMNKLRDSLFWNSTDTWDNKIIVYVNIYPENFELKIVKIIVGLVWWSPRPTLRVNIVTMFKRFRCNLLKTNIKLEGTWLDIVKRLTWTVIHWSNWIYNQTFRKVTYNPNSLGMSRVSISQFHSGLGWDKHRKVWHAIFHCNICYSVFMKQHSRYCIQFWRRGDQQSRSKHLEVNIQKIFIMSEYWVVP